VTARRLDLVAIAPATTDTPERALRYDLGDPNGPLLVAHAPEGATPEQFREVARRIAELGTVVVLPAGWRFEVLELVAPSEGPRTCTTCGARVTVDGCELCEVRR
jgi:hypothetical protein